MRKRSLHIHVIQTSLFLLNLRCCSFYGENNQNGDVGIGIIGRKRDNASMSSVKFWETTDQLKRHRESKNPQFVFHLGNSGYSSLRDYFEKLWKTGNFFRKSLLRYDFWEDYCKVGILVCGEDDSGHEKGTQGVGPSSPVVRWGRQGILWRPICLELEGSLNGGKGSCHPPLEKRQSNNTQIIS